MEALLKEIEARIEKYEIEVDQVLFEKSDGLAEELTELIDSFALNPEDWKRFVHYDKCRYTRNLIAYGKDQRFGLMILAWGPGQRSPIHDHNGSHCIMRVLEGSLTETLYTETVSENAESDSSISGQDNEPAKYAKKRETRLKTGQTAYIHDTIGWHRVTNASTSEPAVSLHLYAPPIEQCKTYCEVEGRVRAQASCPYYSINGIKQREQKREE